MTMGRLILLLIFAQWICACAAQTERVVQLTHGQDDSAGGGPAYIISTPAATYYLEKDGGGLSSMLDQDGVDWLGFHNEEGSGHKGEYRGFPNAVHRQDGNYFHAMNAGTDPSTSVVEKASDEHVRIVFTSGNGQWEGRWDFYPDRCDFTMSQVSSGYKYWIQYEGVPGGEMDATDYWYASADGQRHPIEEPSIRDLPAPEWMAFGDQNSPRMLYVLHHEDDEFPDDYVSRPYMTVLGFGRRDKNKFLDTVQTFSIGFVESTDYSVVDRTIRQIRERELD
ncbi:MAG: hypothetical protein KJP16_01245 [Gammaproteobacteria bacterium]|nr:hypothetical protein [Gammaproteobacteria bacterium]NNL49413.1 hypothetical protein [Woeseiaceae bacterium]